MAQKEKSYQTGTKAIMFEEPDLENPLFIEGLTGIGHIGRNAVSYLIDQLDAEKFGEVLSHHFPHWAIVTDEKELDLMNNEFYYWKSDSEEQRDVIFLVGDTQSVDPMGHYVVTHTIIDILDELGVEDMVTIGGFGTGEMVDEPTIYGVVSDTSYRSAYEELGVSFDHDIGQIIGASGLLLGIGERYGMGGACLLGETPGFLLSDPKATEAVLNVLEELLNVDIDYSSLDEKVKEAEEVIKRIRELQKQAERQEAEEETELGYIG